MGPVIQRLPDTSCGILSGSSSPPDSMNDLDRYDTIRAVAYGDGILRLLDQRRLPFEEVYLDCRDANAVASAITDLVVRGAPAIGIAAAWGVVLEARRLAAAASPVSQQTLEPVLRHLNAARPTAVNLAWALRCMRSVVAG